MTDLATRERVAREVMGLTDIVRAGWREMMQSESRVLEWVLDYKADGDELSCDESREPIPAYEIDIGAAWLVVEKMHERGFGCAAYSNSGVASAVFAVEHAADGPLREAPTTPMAICLAALAALEAK